ncbi:MAG: hypothetical protein K0Q55_2078 [Verrucomicrobia bacterium]|jgi:hypothetical protein|nr:hypothetical protein [Verrucomicrobiota bacterium]
MKAKVVVICVVALLIGVNLAIWYHPQWQVWRAKRDVAQKFEKRIQDFRNSDAQKDATMAAAKGDYWFYSVMGFGWSLPGITNRHTIQHVYERQLYRPISGTSDYSRSKSEAEYNRVAHAYAKAYNLALEKLIPTNRVPTSSTP